MLDTVALSAVLWTFCSSVTASAPTVATPKEVPQLPHPSTTWIPQQPGRVIRTQVQHSSVFVASILIGTPLRTVKCKIDTGFADVWLSARVAEQSQTLIPQPLQKAFAKTPVKAHGKVHEITFSAGKLRGYQGMDTIRLGSRVFENQSVYVLDDASLPKDRDWDAICGLGHHQIATKLPALYSRVAGASPGGLAVFALLPGSYGHAYTVADKVPLSAIKPGTLAWVDADPVHSGHVVDAEPVRSSGHGAFWVVPGGVTTHQNLMMPARFALDTGSPFLLVPPSLYLSLIHSLIPAQMLGESCGTALGTGNVVCDCAVIGVSDVDPLRMKLGKQEFLVNFTDLFEQVPAEEDGEVCQLQIQQSLANTTGFHLLADFLRDPPSNKTSISSRTDPYGSEEANLWVLGNAFLKRYCLFLDFEKNRVGFAEPADSLFASEAATAREPKHEQAPGPSATGGRKTELAADIQVLADQNEQLRRNITSLQNEGQVAKEFHALREAEMRHIIIHLEDEHKSLRDRQASLRHALGEIREKEQGEEEGTSAEVVRRIQQENDQLRVRLVLTQEELRRSEDDLRLQKEHHRPKPKPAMPWSGLSSEVKALSMQNGELLRITEDLRHRNEEGRCRQANFYVALLVSCVASSTVLLLGTYSKLVACAGVSGEFPSKTGQEATTMEMTCSMLERHATELVREGTH